jgi:hypothetical protein
MFIMMTLAMQMAGVLGQGRLVERMMEGDPGVWMVVIGGLFGVLCWKMIRSIGQ